VITFTWLTGLLRRRFGRLAGLAVAVALLVSFTVALGSFLGFVRSEVAARAAADVDVDWQVEVANSTRPADVLKVLGKSPGVTRAQVVGYGDVTRYESSSGGTVQTTGTGKLIGIGPDYRKSFPAEVRNLIGAGRGVLIAQQTAANLHASPGSVVRAVLPSGKSARLHVGGVVDLPRADSFFQKVGAAAGAGPQAPPDNVLIVPMRQWQKLYDPTAGEGVLQVHVRIPRRLPPDPAAAFARLTETRKNDEAQLAGAATIGDNLAARLDSARKDSAYGQLLFFFLGVPGIALGIAIVALVALAGAERRRSEQALLRARGAGPGLIGRTAALEGLIGGILGAGLGTGVAVFVASHLWPSRTPNTGPVVAGIVLGLLTALLAFVIPSTRDARKRSVKSAQILAARPVNRSVLRFVLAGTFAAIAGVAIWYTTRQSYNVVVVPEGIPSVSVNYLSLLGPALAWPAGLLVLAALAGISVSGVGGTIARSLRGVGGAMIALVPPWLRRIKHVAGRSAVLVALAVAFAASTSIFDASFAQQSRVDAELTNGADVSVQAPPGVDVSAALRGAGRVPGVAGAATMQHRFAYVGNDLQDLYGVTPSIARATSFSDTYFADGHATAQLDALARTPDGVFVADETVVDFRLAKGDPIRLRLLDAKTHQYRTVPFHVLGVVREFPTAPTDSFLVANAGYIAQATHSNAQETLLFRTGGRSPHAVASDVRKIVPPGARVQDVESARRIIASGLVAVDVHGLSVIELTFAALASIAGITLLLALTFTERRRSFTVMRALRVAPRQIATFAGAEASAVVIVGCAAGALLGGAVGWTLVKVLRGVFDPPPTHPIVPWGYLSLVFAGVAVAAAITTTVAVRRAARTDASALREFAL
jgi:putative ABC transport system permease protein